jgi:MarR family transcriptional regulator, transcriptional regulator for hemolysin
MKEPTLLRKTELVLWFLMTDVTHEFFQRIDLHMRDLGLSRSQWYVLSALYYYGGISQQELANILDIGKSSTAKLIAEMEKRGWVERKDHEHDGRANRVYLASKVRKSVRNLSSLAIATLKPLLDELSVRDKDQVIAILRRLEMVLERKQGKPTAELLKLKKDIAAAMK